MPDIDLYMPYVTAHVASIGPDYAGVEACVPDVIGTDPLVYDWRASEDHADAQRIVYSTSTGDYWSVSWIAPQLDQIPNVSDCAGYASSWLGIPEEREPERDVSDEEFDDVIEELCG